MTVHVTYFLRLDGGGMQDGSEFQGFVCLCNTGGPRKYESNRRHTKQTVLIYHVSLLLNLTASRS
jgi:hypothetical protein